MALGIKKITESVVEDGRSLIIIGTLNGDRIGIDNEAIPVGAVFSACTLDATSAYVRVKNNLNSQVKINGESIADGTLGTKQIANNAITTEKINNGAVTTEKIADGAVTASKIKVNNVNENHIINSSVTTNKIKDNNITWNKLDSNIQNRIITVENQAKNNENRIATLEKQYSVLRKDHDNLRNEFNSLKEAHNDLVNKHNQLSDRLTQEINNLKSQLSDTKSDITNIIEIKLKNAVMHNGVNSVGQKHGGTSLVNLHCTGDIQGNRVYYMTYQDLAEAYIPGESLDAGDIVAIHNDGKVYRATSINDCIVGVVSDEFANCFGATKEELFNGSKVAVGMIGKVHVKVKGPVKLGQQIGLSVSECGIGSVCGGMLSNHLGIGKALETIDCDFDEINDVLVQIRPM